MGLLDFLKPKRETKADDCYADNPNPKFHRTEREYRLFSEFRMKNFPEIQKRQNRITNSYSAAERERDLTRKIALLEKARKTFETEKAWFYESPGGKLYFEDMWEHLHNARNPDWSYGERIKEELELCLRLRDVIIPGVLEKASAEGGVKQADLYKLFDISQSEFRKIISDMEADGRIERVKKNNAYWIFAK